MASKRANGEGTAYKRKDGRYEAGGYVLTSSGSRKRVRFYGKTRAEAHEKWVAALRKSQQGTPVADVSWRMDQYLEYWLENIVRVSKRPSTYAQYSWAVTRFLKPGLGAYRVDKLTAAAIRVWLNRLSEQGASAHRLRMLKIVLSGALTRAQREELVTRNVAHLVELPKKYQPKERVPWSLDEARRFLAATAGEADHPLYFLLLIYGLRRGEVLGLRWGDIDFEHNVIHVRNQLQRLGGEFVQGPVKTHAGKRDLPILADVRETLIELRLSPPTMPGDLSSDGLVFVTQLGTPRDPDGFSKGFKHSVKRHGLRDIRMHDIRHTAATMLKDLGVQVKEAQVILGHSDIATTLQVYQHANLTSQQEALERVGAALLMPRHSVGTREVVNVAGRCRQSNAGYRQNDASTALLGMLTTSVNNWYPAQESNLQPLVPEFEFSSLRERVQGVERYLAECRKQWLVGAVAVTVAVNIERPVRHLLLSAASLD